ncbi:MAG: hypothetical protein IKJ63_05960 [Clostridia bacterium]|nr:hypothetical protein [Clostridia bacterium]
MMPFIGLGTYVRALFLTILFIEVCVSVSLTLWSFLQKPLLPKIISPVSAISAILFLLPYSAYIFAQKMGVAVNGYSYFQKFLNLPAISVILFTIADAVILSLLLVFFFVKIRHSISAFSVKESADKLKTGICFSYENGMIKLINHKMDELSRIITGKEMTNALDFIKSIRNRECQPGTEVLSCDNDIMIHLPDETVWRFSVKKMGEMYEITAADTTDLYSVSEELRLSNKELKEMNERLLKYGENVDELTKSRERLETKYRIHADLGNALLATRLYLQNNDGNADDIINIWRRNITALGVKYSEETEYDDIKGLIDAAKAVGIKVHISGDMPEKEYIKKLFTEATAEALTNAVKHADAKHFNISFTSNLFSFTASFSNDGKKADVHFSEGGGLSSLRKKTERMGGRMTVETEPAFNLILKVPK